MCRAVYGMTPEQIVAIIDNDKFGDKMNEPLNIRYEYTDEENSTRRHRRRKPSVYNRFLIWVVANEVTQLYFKSVFFSKSGTFCCG